MRDDAQRFALDEPQLEQTQPDIAVFELGRSGPHLSDGDCLTNANAAQRNRLFCPHRLGRNRLGELRVLCYQYGGDSESGLAPIGSPENWRCVVFEKLRRVELLRGSWKTAPNHSRPATCIVDADIDAEDQPERDPQKGH